MLLGLLNIKLLGLLKVMCEVLEQQQVGRKFESHTKEASGTQTAEQTVPAASI